LAAWPSQDTHHASRRNRLAQIVGASSGLLFHFAASDCRPRAASRRRGLSRRPQRPAACLAQTGISRFSANRPELAAICARILSLQSALGFDIPAKVLAIANEVIE
jgi:hypothetical protein